MTESSSRSSRFDRIVKPDPTVRRRDQEGKEALYSTGPTAEPSSQLRVFCHRCDVETGVSLWDLRRILVPPVLVRPIKQRVFARCPTCGHRAWLEIQQGQALRAFRSRRIRRPPG